MRTTSVSGEVSRAVSRVLSRTVFAGLAGLLVAAGTAGAVALPAAPAVAAPAGPAVAAPTVHDQVVSDDPGNSTPNVLDGQVHTVVQVGTRMFAGGEFTQVSAQGSTTVVTRRNLVAFSATTGAIDPTFAPEVDGRVEAIAVAPDSGSIYLGGAFETVDGVRSKSVARIDLTTGAPVAGFRTAPLNGVARDITLLGDRLYVAGSFSRVSGMVRPAFTALDPTTGAADPAIDLGFGGVHNGGTTSVVKMAVTPNGARMVVIGNFRTVSGQPRSQLAVLELGATRHSLSDWSTTRYQAPCNTVFDSYLRDAAVSPDGRYFVAVTTGGYGAGTLCDAAARFELGAGAGQQPSWVNSSGGDTLSAVAITGPVVYVGGHNRWMNNPFAADNPGPGAVDRSGLSALDPANGLPYSWNPGRTRGVAVYDFLVTPAGLWFTSDTAIVAGERRERVAFFPLAGGTSVAAAPESSLPGQVYLGARAGGSATGLYRRGLSTSGAGGLQVADGGGVDWSQVRGSVLIGGTLYTGSTDGSFSARTATTRTDGLHLGPATPVDTADRLTPMAVWHTTIPSITAMAYRAGRLYYTVADRAALYSRTFEPQSGIVGADEATITATLADLDWRTVGGMFLAGDRLYTTNSATGALSSTAVSESPAGVRPVVGTTRAVSGPAVDGADWRARAVFLDSGAAPTAVRPRKSAPDLSPGTGRSHRKPAPRLA